jgi:crossover junction endodeoxyribonuclease RuvC
MRSLPASGLEPRLREQMFDSVVLGVDPGLARCGLAVVGIRDRRHRLVWATTLTTHKDVAEADRLASIVDLVRDAIDSYAPLSVAVERVAWSRNQVSAMQVARATGAVMATAAGAGLPVEEYGPNEVKQAVTGAGNADKAQVRRALERVHGLGPLPSGDDTADAVAVALTHLLASGMRTAASRALVR